MLVREFLLARVALDAIVAFVAACVLAGRASAGETPAATFFLVRESFLARV